MGLGLGHRVGLIAFPEERSACRYQPKSDEFARLVNELDEFDRTHPVTLINMIYARRQDVQAFANAFKLRKDSES